MCKKAILGNLILGSLIITLSLSCTRQKIPVLETGSLVPMPDEWIDLDTGHKIKRLTRRDGDNRSFYFHNRPFLPAVDGKGDLMVFYGSDKPRSDDKLFLTGEQRNLYTVNLKTLEIEQLSDHPNPISGEILGTRTRRVYYRSADSVFATNVDDKKTRLVYVFPDSLSGNITTLNADETLLGGVISGLEKQEIMKQFPRKGDFFTRIFEARIPHTLITVDVETGEMKEIFSDSAWLNHVQFSPADPNLMMFCHEGPWHEVNRIWTIDLLSGEAEMMHERTVYREIAGHEFMSPDGKTIWFDLQKPRGETFYLAGLNLETGVEKHYGLTRDEWSIHFNISPDQQLFSGDGGDPGQVARAENGKWLYLFQPGTDSLRSEKLVNMKNHDYDLEPNVHFSPDGEWIIFRANFNEAGAQSYAVEIKGGN